MPNQSPSPKVVAINTMDFPSAIQEIIQGKKITKLEWGNKKVYGFLNPNTNFLSLHKEDGKDYQWIISDGDLLGNDWIVIGEAIIN